MLHTPTYPANVGGMHTMVTEWFSCGFHMSVCVFFTFSAKQVVSKKESKLQLPDMLRVMILRHADLSWFWIQRSVDRVIGLHGIRRYGMYSVFFCCYYYHFWFCLICIYFQRSLQVRLIFQEVSQRRTFGDCWCKIFRHDADMHSAYQPRQCVWLGGWLDGCLSQPVLCLND